MYVFNGMPASVAFFIHATISGFNHLFLLKTLKLYFHTDFKNECGSLYKSLQKNKK